MRENLRVEFTKAFHSKYFAVTLTIATALAVWSSIHSIQYYFRVQNMLSVLGKNKNPDLAADTLFNHWMGENLDRFLPISTILYSRFLLCFLMRGRFLMNEKVDISKTWLPGVEESATLFRNTSARS